MPQHITLYWGWCFDTDSSDLDLDPIIAIYNFRWRIETTFIARDGGRVRAKSRDIRIRYFLHMND